MRRQQNSLQHDEVKTYKVSRLPIRESSTGIGPLILFEERFLMKGRWQHITAVTSVLENLWFMNDWEKKLMVYAVIGKKTITEETQISGQMLKQHKKWKIFIPLYDLVSIQNKFRRQHDLWLRKQKGMWLLMHHHWNLQVCHTLQALECWRNGSV